MRAAVVAKCLFLTYLMVAVHAPSAWADRVDDQIALMRDGDYKLRLSAALWLAKRDDPRALMALSHRLEGDSSTTIRRVAALALGQRIGSATPTAVRERARRSLERAAQSDRDRQVRRNAKRSLARLFAGASNAETRTPTAQSPSSSSASSSGSLSSGDRRASRVGSGGVFVHISAAPSKGRGMAPKMSMTLSKTLSVAVTNTMRQRAPHYRLEWPSGTPPTQAELQETAMLGYFVGAVTDEVRVERRGKQVEIACSVSIRIGPWQGRDVPEKWSAHQSASATGAARVITDNRQRSIDDGQRDCVRAVAEEVTASKVVPFLRNAQRVPRK